MILEALYYGKTPIVRVYRGGEIVFDRSPVEFHVVEDDKLVIVGALNANSFSDGLYLDCAPDAEWIDPVQNGNVLSVEQVYTATQSGNVLTIE